MIQERWVQRIKSGHEQALAEIDQKFREAQSEYGFPVGKRYQVIAGTEDVHTFVYETEWESLSAMDAAYAQWLADPRARDLATEQDVFMVSARLELYWLVE